MREKKQKIVFTFLTTEQAMAVESLSRNRDLPGRMIPVPPEIKSGCGLCWCCQPYERIKLEDAFHSLSLSFEAVHEIMLYESIYIEKSRFLS